MDGVKKIRVGCILNTHLDDVSLLSEIVRFIDSSEHFSFDARGILSHDAFLDYEDRQEF